MNWLIGSVILYFGVRWVRSTIERGARRTSEKSTTKPRIAGESAPPRPPSASPKKKTQLLAHEVLGVPEDASLEQIQARYRKLVVEYHPDKQASSAVELQELAGKRLREINSAYAALVKARE